MRNQPAMKVFAIFVVVFTVSVTAAPQRQYDDNDVAIDISKEVYAVPEEKIGDISEDVPANILTNRQRRDTEDEVLEGNDEDAAIASLFDADSFQEEDPHLSAPAPSLPLAPDTPAADIPIEASSDLISEEIEAEPFPSHIEEESHNEPDPIPAHIFTPDGYEYKTVRRVQYRYRHRN
ncbi:hypothetical protein ACFFRR_000124 [Megaselia abdita]